MNKKTRQKKEKLDAWTGAREREGAFLQRVAKDWTLESLLADLGISVSMDWEQLQALLQLVKGKFTALDALREGITHVEDFGSWQSGEYVQALSENRMPTLDEIVDHCELSRLEVAAGLAAAGMLHGIDRARSILGATLPDVFLAAAENAVNGKGAVAQADRRLLFEASGVMPKGPNTIVSINNNNNVVQVGLPQWQEVDKVVATAYFDKKAEQRGLPAARTQDTVEQATVVEGEFVEVPS